MATAASQQRPVQRLLILLDAVILLLAVGVAPLEHHLLSRWVPLRDLPSFGIWQTEYTLLVVLTLPIWLAIASRLELFRVLDRRWTLGRLGLAIAELQVLGFIVLATLLYATQIVVNRSLMALFLVNATVAMFTCRGLLVAWARFRYRRGEGRTRLLLVGAPDGPLGAFAVATRRADFAPHLVGYLADDEAASPAMEGIRRLGNLSDLARVLHDEAVDQVLFFRPYDRADGLDASLLTCETLGTPALLAVDVGLPAGKVPELSLVYDRPFASLESSARRPDLLALKHLFDFAFALLCVLAFAPLLLLVSLAIGLSMGRPILFAQDRAGLRGRPFRMLKFRTMVVDAAAQRAALAEQNEMTGPVFKIAEDPRITALGRILRKTSIDELPQLFHVLTGTMSIVGPRPLPLDEQRGIHGWHRRRLAMRPGITGLWQVSGRSDTGFTRWMELDLEYVDRWSLWLDTTILLRTVPVVLLQRGAR